MNKALIIGRIGKDATENTVKDKRVANFSVAVSKKINGQEQTTWFDVALWGKEGVYPYLKKGTLVYVEGEVSLNLYHKNDGTTGGSLRINAFQVELLGGKESGDKNVSHGTPAPANEGPASGISGSDDLPF